MISLMKDMDLFINKTEFQFASIVLPVVRNEKEASILFEVRGQKLSQPGEICFPGGHIEPGESPLEAALRETEEELLISREQIHNVSPIGILPTPSERTIFAYSAELSDYTGTFSSSEVSQVFLVPLSFFSGREPDIYHCSISVAPEEDFPFSLIPRGKDYHWHQGRYPVFFYKYQEHIIWGLTAKILYDFIKRSV